MKPGEIPFRQTREFPTVHMNWMADATLDVLGKKRGEILIVGTHPQLNSSKAFVGDTLASITRFPEQFRTHVVDEPSLTLFHLKRMVRDNLKRFPVVLAAFEAHHYHDTEVADFFHLLSELSHGTVMIADYTLAGMNGDEVKGSLQSRVESILQGFYGTYERWFRAHIGFSAQSLQKDISDSADWTSGEGFIYSPHRAGFIGSTDLTDDELGQIVSGKTIQRN
jgi:hypothetical protein